MAELIVVESMLVRIGFTNDARDLITGDQGIDSIDELRILDDDMMENL